MHRHPHVFGAVEADTADQVRRNWEDIKRAEKGRDSVLDGIPAGLPSLAYAEKLQRRAAPLGVDAAVRPELDARGVGIVTLCIDTPEQIRAGRAKHGAKAVMLSDADLAVTDRFNLRNPTNFAPGAKGGPPTFRPLPIPTTILVDAQGVVRWIDQSTDYQVRSDPERVRRALNAALA